ncbi:acyl-CoA dehydrogenase family protein [Azotobacter salinestris]|uniref:acyl-CoA dehydrogenase family protein n=1 Tax=Azotobacter salinestris TaxID=69964 RepID=UPI003D7F74C2
MQQFGKPSSELQALQLKLADMLTQSTASRQMVVLASDRLDRGHPQATLLLLCDGQALCHPPVPRNPERGPAASRRPQLAERLSAGASGTRQRRIPAPDDTNGIMRAIIVRHALEKGGTRWSDRHHPAIALSRATQGKRHESCRRNLPFRSL